MTQHTPAQVHEARRFVPVVGRETAATIGTVISFWRDVIGEMHDAAHDPKNEDQVDAGIVEGWIEKLELLIKIVCDANDSHVEQLRIAGWTRQCPHGGMPLTDGAPIGGLASPP